MLRFKDTEFWKTLTSFFECRKKLDLYRDINCSLIREKHELAALCEALNTQVQESKAIYDAMDRKHIEDKQTMAQEIESLREKYEKIRATQCYEAANPNARIDVEFVNGRTDVRESVWVGDKNDTCIVRDYTDEFGKTLRQEIIYDKRIIEESRNESATAGEKDKQIKEKFEKNYPKVKAAVADYESKKKRNKK